MASRTTITLIDDVDGSPADETVTFSLDGVTYEIDLTSERAAELREALARWVAAGRKTGGGRSGSGRSRRAPAAGGPSADEIRQWAKANGHHVSDRGRIAAEIKAAYEAAH